MTAILSILIIAGSTYIGYNISSKYRIRYNFFNDFKLILKNVKQNLNFKLDKLLDIFSSEIETIKSKELYQLINEYTIYLKNKNFQNKFYFNINYLTKNENETIMQILNSLGRNDLFGENLNFEYIEEVTNGLFVTTKNEYIKFDKLYLKLGFFLGCLIVILFI